MKISTLRCLMLVTLLAIIPVKPVQAADDSLWDKVKEQGAEWYEDAKDKAPEVYDDLKEKGGELYDKAKEKAPELKDKAVEKLGEAQQNVQEFRENQESEFWQRFEEQVGAPVGPGSTPEPTLEEHSEQNSESPSPEEALESEISQTENETVATSEGDHATEPESPLVSAANDEEPERLVSVLSALAKVIAAMALLIIALALWRYFSKNRR